MLDLDFKIGQVAHISNSQLVDMDDYTMMVYLTDEGIGITEYELEMFFKIV